MTRHIIGGLLIALIAPLHAAVADLDWDDVVVETTITRNEASPEIELVRLWANTEPGTVRRYIRDYRGDQVMRFEGGERSSPFRMEQEIVHEFGEPTPSGLIPLTRTEIDISSRYKVGDSWRDRDLDPPTASHLIIDSLQNIEGGEREWEADHAIPRRLSGVLLQCVVFGFPTNEARVGDRWNRVAHIDGYEGAVASGEATVRSIEETPDGLIITVHEISRAQIDGPFPDPSGGMSGIPWQIERYTVEGESTATHNLTTGDTTGSETLVRSNRLMSQRTSMNLFNPEIRTVIYETEGLIRTRLESLD